MVDYQAYINALRKCAKEHENDRTPTGHMRVSDLCQDTANLLEEVEREQSFINKPCASEKSCEYDKQRVLEKISAEIDKIYEREGSSFDCLNALDELKELIDKIQAESEANT